MIRYFVKFKIYDYPETSEIIETGSGGYTDIDDVKRDICSSYCNLYNGEHFSSDNLVILALNTLTI